MQINAIPNHFVSLKKSVIENWEENISKQRVEHKFLLSILLSMPFDKLFWSCLRDLHADKLHEAILANLKKLSFATMGSGQIHDDHPNHHFFTPEGHLVSTKRLVYIVDQDDGLQRVSYYTVDKAKEH